VRQPIRTIILSILVAAAAFAFVARATEFIVVQAEIARIEAFYRAVGILTPTSFTNFTTDHDVTRALDLIERHRNVAISDNRRFTQGVMSDINNLVIQHQQEYFNPGLNQLDVPVMDHYFIGNLIRRPVLSVQHDNFVILVEIHVQELWVGDSRVLREGDTVFTNEWGQTTTLRSRYMMRLLITPEEAQAFSDGTWSPFYDVYWTDDSGGFGTNRTLFRATPTFIRTPGPDPFHGWVWHLRGIIGDDGIYMDLENHNPRPFMGVYDPRYIVSHSGIRDVVFAINAYDTAAMEAAHTYLYETMALLRENQSSVIVTETYDMTAIPRFTDHRVARLVETRIFQDGRLLTYEDYGKPVAVIPMPLAVRRGLRHGDTITVTLRDNPRPYWIDEQTHSTWARGIENWWDSNPAGWWAMTQGASHNWRAYSTYELELEIVGVFEFAPMDFNNFTASEIFIPAGLIPAGFGWDNAPHLTGMYSFVLDSPRSEERFVRDTRTALYNLGFTATFLPNDFEHLASATDPIRMSIMINLVVFGAASVLILAFVVFLYLRQWRKSVAVAQALGAPRRKVLRQLFVPVIAFWVPAIIIGSIVAWFFALDQAETALASLAEYETTAMPGLYLLFVLCTLLILFVFAWVLFGGHNIVRRPVLVQLQGGVQKRQKTKVVDPGVVPENFVFGTFELTPVCGNAKGSSVFGAGVKHSVRHIFRTPVKTLLALTLAVIFVFSLGWLDNTIRFTESEIERLWETTAINAEVFRVADDEEEAVDVSMWPSIISRPAWNAIAFSGFLGDVYLESTAWGSTAAIFGVSNLHGLIDENTKTPIDEQLGVLCDDIEIEFLPGFSFENFVYTPGEPIPMVIRRGMYEPTVMGDGTDYVYARVIGFFGGGLQRGINRFGDDMPTYVIPFDAYISFFTGRGQFFYDVGFGSFFNTIHPPILTARFNIAQDRIREIYQLRDLTQTILAENTVGGFGVLPLILYVDDSVIYNVIIPMEENLSLLRILYPIAIGAAFLLALGLSLLTMLQNAINAAIMRVLGKPKGFSRFVLCTEQLLVCTMGVILGLLLLLILGIVGIAPLYLAGVYFAGAIIGSVIGAYVISARAPLDLLQVRE